MTKFTTIPISVRIALGYMVMMLLLAISGFSSVFNISKLASALEFVSGPALQASNGGIDTAFNIQREVLKTQQVFLKQLDVEKGLEEIYLLHKKGEVGFNKVKDSGLINKDLLRETEESIALYVKHRNRSLSLYNKLNVEKQKLVDLTDQVLESVILTQEDIMIAMDASPNDRRTTENYRDIEQILSEIKTLILSRNYALQQLFNGAHIEKQRQVMKEQYSLLFPAYERSLVMLSNQGFEEYAENLKQSLGALFPLFEQVTQLHVNFSFEQKKAFKTAEILLLSLNDIKSQGEEKILNHTYSVVSLVDRAKGLIWLVIISGLLVGIAAMLVTFLTVVKPIKMIADNLHKIGDGDSNLHVKLSENGAKELSILSIGFNLFVNKIKRTVLGVSEAVKKLGHQTDNLATISDTTRKVIAEQTANTEHVVDAIDQLVESTSEIAESAAHAANAAQEADGFSESGKHEVYAMIQAIRSQVGQLNSTSIVMNKLSQDSQRIGEVLSVINDIAEQTNLLALNAAIEAARAGDKGRGFAVVADEVRTLASNTQRATTTIQNVINELQNATKEADASVAYTLKIAESGVTQAEKADDILKKITAAIGTINTVNMQVATATQQQTAITQSIKDNIYSVSHKAVETSQSFDEINESIEIIISVVESLEGGVKQFKLN